MKKMNLIKKIAVTGTVAALGVAMLSATVIAGSFQTDEKGKWYKEDDGSYPKSTWKWLDTDGDGNYECYAFDENGYLYVSTTTPDSYTTDENGAWIEDGALKTRKQGEDLSDLAIGTGSSSESSASLKGASANDVANKMNEINGVQGVQYGTTSQTISLQTPNAISGSNVTSDQLVTKINKVVRKDVNGNSEDSAPDMSKTSYDTNGPGVPEGAYSESIAPTTDTSRENVLGPDGTADPLTD